MRHVAMRHLLAFVAVAVGIPALASSALGADPCALLSSADILKATGLKVGNGMAGPPILGTLGKCTWPGDGNKVIVTFADAQHMRMTVEVQEKRGGTPVSGLGSKAVAVKGAGAMGGGSIVSVLDAKGGFGVSILGPAGTVDRASALAKVVASRR
jgi:hypothetical protein